MGLPEDDPLAGARPVRFEILRRLGAGAMGVVYEAVDRDSKARLALKTLRSADGPALRRFKDEYRALQHIHHPNLVRLGELVEEAGRWFFTMELVDGGRTFLAHVRSGASELALETTLTGPDVPLPQPPLPQGGAVDEPKLRDALVQLARGIVCLHGAGKIHRDVKPSNVLVDSRGRVVILDFGLIADRQQAGSSRDIVGTVAYMAPEQAAGKGAGPAADWYAIGVMLYQALTGHLPHTGEPREVLLRKQELAPAPPRELFAAVPADLERLCMRLLAPSPEARPTGEQVLSALGERDAATLAAAAVEGDPDPPFTGRGSELAELERAFAAALGGRAVSVIVQGESGVGKTALVREFVTGAARRALVLCGRCHERESVPYKVIDGIIDSFSRHLAQLPQDEAARLLGSDAALLGSVFPVLFRAGPGGVVPRQGILEARELRTRLFIAVRELFARLCSRGPTIVWIDDLQWADRDGLALLAEVLREPDAPPIFFVATSRASAVPAELGPARVLTLSGLPAEDAAQLAGILLERARVQPAVPTLPMALAREAAGHPLFLSELAWHGTAEAGSLDQVLWTRVERLDVPARRVLELVATATRPAEQDIICQAAGLDRSGFADALGRLRGSNFVRTGGIRLSDPVEPYHDRVRESVLAHVPADVLRDRHRQLAGAFLTTAQPDPELLAVHLRGAGEVAQAATFAIQAADAAARALAFDHAADLYAQALEAGEDRVLRRKRAEVLANAGRGAESAAEYLRACDGAGADESLDLRRLAAEQFLVSGEMENGVAVTRRLLAEVGLRMASTRRGALVSALRRRAWLRLRGFGFRPRNEADIPKRRLQELDLCWSLSKSFSNTSMIHGFDFQTRHLLLALRAGERRRTARALGMEACYAAATGGAGGRSRRRRLLARAAQLAAEVEDSHLAALITFAEGSCESLEGEFRRCHQSLTKAERVFLEQCTGIAWELDVLRNFLQSALYFDGHVAEVIRRFPEFLGDAERRGNKFALVNAWAHGWMALPARDEPAQLLSGIDEAMKHCPRDGFDLQRFWILHAKCVTALYVGDAAKAQEHVAAMIPIYRAAMLSRIEFDRILFHDLVARTALCAATTSKSSRDLERAERAAEMLERQQTAWATGLSLLARAGVAQLRGCSDRAVHLLERAESVHQEMRLYREVARRSRGMLMGGSEGHALVAASEAWMVSEGIKNPGRMSSMFLPALV